MRTKSVSVLGVIVFTGSAALYQGSDWWERACATYDSSEMSPDGCIRIDTYDPFFRYFHPYSTEFRTPIQPFGIPSAGNG